MSTGLLGKNRPREHTLFNLHYSTFFQTCFYITWQVITSCLWLQMGRTANNQMQIKNSLQQMHYCIVMASLLLTRLVKALPLVWLFGWSSWVEMERVGGWPFSSRANALLGGCPLRQGIPCDIMGCSMLEWYAQAGIAPIAFYNTAKIRWANPTRIINLEAWLHLYQNFSFLSQQSDVFQKGSF